MVAGNGRLTSVDWIMQKLRWIGNATNKARFECSQYRRVDLGRGQVYRLCLTQLTGCRTSPKVVPFSRVGDFVSNDPLVRQSCTHFIELQIVIDNLIALAERLENSIAG
jgi:hypothetical protein